MKKYIAFVLFLFLIFPTKAFNTDNLQVSLLTVMPRPNEVYTIYGHSALRLHDPEKNMDEVYNWGTFSFGDSPLFIYRFIKGETDYFLSTSSFSHFISYYAETNSTVVEQVLNLSAEEKMELIKIVNTNLLPENLVYRYNFLFDNCTTRIRDIVERSTKELVSYPKQEDSVTFRDLIHSCTRPYPWMSFGIDLLIGSGADSLINQRQETFLPEKLKEVFDNTNIIANNGSEKRTLVISSQKIIQSIPTEKSNLFLISSPFYTGLLVLFFYLAVVICGIIKKKEFKFLFSILFFISGAAGTIIAFLILFSTHPCVSPNWNIVWLHPLHFIGFAGYFFKKSYHLISLYHNVNLLLLCFLLISWHWLPQTLNIANIPFILCLITASTFWLFNKKKNKNE